jgi:hypothetical protein
VCHGHCSFSGGYYLSSRAAPLLCAKRSPASFKLPKKGMRLRMDLFAAPASRGCQEVHAVPYTQRRTQLARARARPSDDRLKCDSFHGFLSQIVSGWARFSPIAIRHHM